MYHRIVETIRSATGDYGENDQLKNLWKEPLVEIISAGDKRLAALKEAVSPEHLMPISTNKRQD
jgi:hypothetical protein